MLTVICSEAPLDSIWATRARVPCNIAVPVANRWNSEGIYQLVGLTPWHAKHLFAMARPAHSREIPYGNMKGIHGLLWASCRAWEHELSSGQQIDSCLISANIQQTVEGSEHIRTFVEVVDRIWLLLILWLVIFCICASAKKTLFCLLCLACYLLYSSHVPITGCWNVAMMLLLVAGNRNSCENMDIE